MYRHTVLRRTYVSNENKATKHPAGEVIISTWIQAHFFLGLIDSRNMAKMSPELKGGSSTG